MKGPLANYSSDTPAGVSIAQIESMLIEHGVLNLSKQVKNGRIDSLLFSIQVDGRAVNILLPANIPNVFTVLRKARLVQLARGTMTPAAEAALMKQAERTAWRIQLDWVRIQLSLVRMNQAAVLEIFLPYVFDGERTFYQMLKDRKFAGLLPAPKEP